MCLFFSTSTESVVECQNSQVAQQLSHRALLEQCRKAYLTEELLQDLNNFNFEAFLNFETFPNYGHRVDYLTEELPLFFEWIKDSEQVCPGFKIPKGMPNY